MVRVAGTADAEWFLRSGRAGYDAIAAHVPLAEKDAVLDFGCGCGRVTRYWNEFDGAVSGGDVNAKAIEWCRDEPRVRELRAATRWRRRSTSTPRASTSCTRSPSSRISPAELQIAWRDEMLRVLDPAGTSS